MHPLCTDPPSTHILLFCFVSSPMSQKCDVNPVHCFKDLDLDPTPFSLSSHERSIGLSLRRITDASDELGWFGTVGWFNLGYQQPTLKEKRKGAHSLPRALLHSVYRLQVTHMTCSSAICLNSLASSMLRRVLPFSLLTSRCEIPLIDPAPSWTVVLRCHTTKVLIRPSALRQACLRRIHRDLDCRHCFRSPCSTNETPHCNTIQKSLAGR